MKKILFVFLSLLISISAIAQDFSYGVTTREELEMKKYNKDTSAHAVILSEYGNAKLTVTNADEVRLIIEYHVKIKLFDSKAFNKGTIEIPTYRSGDYFEEVDDIQGTTTYLNDNGGSQTAVFDQGKVYREKRNENYTNVKFALPGLRNGCVIEYKYQITTPYFHNFYTWHFQGDTPKMYSEYEITIPGFWNYNSYIRGLLKLDKNVATLDRACFSSHGALADCSHVVYAMKDIPAFIGEDYMTAPKNFESAMYFELSDYTNPYTGVKTKYTRNWTDVDNDLKRADYFGAQIKRTNLFKTTIPPVIANKIAELDKAMAVYTYIQKTLKWNEMRSRGSKNLNKILEAHTGDAGDINLALVTALNFAGINTEAVLLSTRQNGVVNKLYATEDDFDYVVAKVNIGDKSYFLDATDPLLPFGTLPIRCINGEGRVMSLNKPSYWVELKPNDTRKSTFALDLTLGEDGKIKGTFTHYSLGYDAYDKRKAIKKFNSIDEYLDDLTSKMGKMKILKSEILNLDSLNKPLSESYEIEFTSYKNLENRLAFNPFLFDRTATNPFRLNERSYPVDWGMPNEKRFILTMHLPPDYTVETEPQKVSIGMPNQGGRFVTDYVPGTNTFTFSHITQFSKSIYGPEEYPYLKELYNKIIQSEKSELIFKKKI